MEKTRILYMDILRIMATAAVVIYHTTMPTESLENISSFLLNWCVPIFCMLTGGLFWNSNKTYYFEIMIRKYIVRILCIIGFWGVIYNIIAESLVRHSVNIHIFLNAVVRVLTADTTYCYHFWYLYMLVGLYLLIPIVKPALDKWNNWDKPNRESWLVFYVFLFISVIIPTISNISGVEILELMCRPYTPYIFYLFCGYWLSKWGIPKWLRVILISSCVIQTLIIMYFFFINEISVVYSIFGYGSFITWSAAVLIFDAVRRIDFSKLSEKGYHIVESLSKDSLGIFVFHVMILMGIKTICSYIGLNINPYIFMILQFCFAIGVSLIVTRIVKKIPVLKELV